MFWVQCKTPKNTTKKVPNCTQRDLLPLPNFLQSVDHERHDHVDCRSLRPETVLLFRQYPFGLAVDAQVAADGLEDHFTGMGYEGNAPETNSVPFSFFSVLSQWMVMASFRNNNTVGSHLWICWLIIKTYLYSTKAIRAYACAFPDSLR